jgi:predicted MFS family arabinose efflux permease
MSKRFYARVTLQPTSTDRSSRLGVLADPAFLRFWLGESISLVGSEVSTLALPLTAVLILDATPEQMGALTAIHLVPFLLVGLPAGVWVDRFSRRRLLVGSDLVNAVTIGLVPIAAIARVLSMPVLYLVYFLIGLVDVVAAVAWQAFVPSIVGRERLIEANARLEASSSVASIVGPGLGGALVQLLTAPIALVVDAASFLISAVMVWSVRVTEPVRPPDVQRASARSEIVEGLRLVLRTPALRALMSGGAIHNFFSRMVDALFVLYAVDVLRLGPAEIGLAFAAGGPGSLLAAATVGWLGRPLGVGTTIWTMQVLTGISRLLVPVAAIAAPGAALAILALSNFLLGFARTAFNVTQVSLRVAITPDHLHGRMNATIRFLMWSVTPVGALVGGILAATVLGLTGTMVLAGVGVLAAVVPFLAPSLRTVREIPN